MEAIMTLPCLHIHSLVHWECAWQNQTLWLSDVTFPLLEEQTLSIGVFGACVFSWPTTAALHHTKMIPLQLLGTTGRWTRRYTLTHETAKASNSLTSQQNPFSNTPKQYELLSFTLSNKPDFRRYCRRECHACVITVVVCPGKTWWHSEQ